ncbi:hypothetical protein [Streptomyces sp. NPDC000880]
MPSKHVPGRDPLPAARYDAIRAGLDAAPDGEHQDARDLLGELDRIRSLFDTTMAANGELIELMSQMHNVHIHPIAGTFCRTCSANVEDKPDGCDQHSPVRILRRLLAMHEKLNSRYAERLDAAAIGADRASVEASRGLEAYAMLTVAAELLGPALAAVETAQADAAQHKDGCRPYDCRCGCNWQQNCQDCHRCVCWRAECCAEVALQGALEREADGPRCAVCRTPIAEHSGRICDRSAARR